MQNKEKEITINLSRDFKKMIKKSDSFLKALMESSAMPKRKCVLCSKKKYADNFVTIAKEIQGIQNFDICKSCLNQLKIMLEVA